MKLFINALDNKKPLEPIVVVVKNQIMHSTDEVKDKTKKIKKNELNEILNHLEIEYERKKYNTDFFYGYFLESEKKEYNDPNLFENDKKNIKDIIKEFTAAKAAQIEKKTIKIDFEINNLSDLISLAEKYHDVTVNDECNINILALHKIKKSLIDLNNMIGMKSIKENVVDQILFFLQDLHKGLTVENNEFMHTVIYGPPGTGKTEVAKILGSIFSNLGILKKGIFKKVTRSDLIAGYLGQTAIKTKDVIKDCLGGCLFIDEAYSLGNNEKRDSFSKECIDTLCEALSDHKEDLMVIIAGYEKELNECFFSYNQGLDSRFVWRFKTEEYTGEDLYNIFLKKVKDTGWNVKEDSINKEWFHKNKEYFKFFGRDMETLLSKTKIAHSRRVFLCNKEEKKWLIMKDLEKGMEIFLKNDEVKNRKENEDNKKKLYSMYI
jgi:SpoVK/Ycf46/Vps4 family AAA+-type ATPase